MPGRVVTTSVIRTGAEADFQALLVGPENYTRSCSLSLPPEKWEWGSPDCSDGSVGVLGQHGGPASFLPSSRNSSTYDLMETMLYLRGDWNLSVVPRRHLNKAFLGDSNLETPVMESTFFLFFLSLAALGIALAFMTF